MIKTLCVTKHTFDYSGVGYTDEELTKIEGIMNALEDNQYDGLLNKLVYHIDILENMTQELAENYRGLEIFIRNKGE